MFVQMFCCAKACLTKSLKFITKEWQLCLSHRQAVNVKLVALSSIYPKVFQGTVASFPGLSFHLFFYLEYLAISFSLLFTKLPQLISAGFKLCEGSIFFCLFHFFVFHPGFILSPEKVKTRAAWREFSFLSNFFFLLRYKTLSLKGSFWIGLLLQLEFVPSAWYRLSHISIWTF